MQWDKLSHAGMYAVLGATLGWGRHHSIPSPPHWVVIGVGALYGATDEWHQAFVPRRTPSLGDWIADLSGVSVGYILTLIALAWLASRMQPKMNVKDAP